MHVKFEVPSKMEAEISRSWLNMRIWGSGKNSKLKMHIFKSLALWKIVKILNCMSICRMKIQKSRELRMNLEMQTLK